MVSVLACGLRDPPPPAAGRRGRRPRLAGDSGARAREWCFCLLQVLSYHAGRRNQAEKEEGGGGKPDRRGHRLRPMGFPSLRPPPAASCPRFPAEPNMALPKGERA